MKRIDKTFEKLRDGNRKAFVAYICGGDPDLATTKSLVLAFEKSGVDIVELGVPFSDPLADGVVNQRASERALKNNVSLRDILSLVKEIRKESEIPIVLFTYINPILKFGVDEFPAAAKDAGVDGVLALDYPIQEWGNYKQLMDDAGVATIGLIAPTSSEERIDIITGSTTGFIYYVSRTGVTGMRDAVQQSVGPMVRKIKSRTDVPVVVGFGISKPEHVTEIASYADGVVVGSAIVKKIEENIGGGDAVSAAAEFAAQLTAPLKKG